MGGACGRGDGHRPGQHRVSGVRGGGVQDQAAEEVSTACLDDDDDDWYLQESGPRPRPPLVHTCDGGALCADSQQQQRGGRGQAGLRVRAARRQDGAHDNLRSGHERNFYH